MDLTNKIEVYKNGWAPYDVAEGDIIELEYENGTLSGASCTGKLIEVGAKAIIVDCSLGYSSDVRTIQKKDLIDIKAQKKKGVIYADN